MSDREEISQILVGELFDRYDVPSLQSMQLLAVRRKEIFLEIFDGGSSAEGCHKRARWLLLLLFFFA